MIAYLILFIKILKYLRQLFGAKKVVAQSFLIFCCFSIFLENDRVSLFINWEMLTSAPGPLVKYFKW